MTREEAIKVLEKQFDKSCGNYRYQNAEKLDFEDALWVAISALRQEDHFREVTKKVEPQWISVKDRLPEMGEHYQSEDVLVCIDYRPDDPGTTEDTYVSIDHVGFNCFGQGEFSCERDDPRDGEPSPYFVTHWMPLPEPPVEGTV